MRRETIMDLYGLGDEDMDAVDQIIDEIHSENLEHEIEALAEHIEAQAVQNVVGNERALFNENTSCLSQVRGQGYTSMSKMAT